MSGLLADPDRQRRAPIALARERPIHVVRQEIAEAAVADVLRLPLDLPVVRDKVVLELRGLDEPALARVLDQRILVRAGAEGIAVVVLVVFEERAAFFENADDRLVRRLAELAGDGGLIVGVHIRHAVIEGTVRLYKTEEADALFLADPVVVLTEGGREMYDTGTRLQFDEVARDDDPMVLAVAAFHVLGRVIVEERGVVQADEIRALDGAEHLRVFAEVLLHQRLRDDELFVLMLYDGVVDLRANGRGAIAGKGPGRRRPDE